MHGTHVVSIPGPVVIELFVDDDDDTVCEQDAMPTMVRGADARPVVELEDPAATLPPDPGPARMRLPVEGTRFDRYEVGRVLGQGTFGRVHAARDTKLGREVALKFLHPAYATQPEVVERFFQEARAAACIAHPGIATVFDSGLIAGTDTAVDGVAFIVFELLDGESLRARLERCGRVSPQIAMELGRQIAATLEAAHRKGVIHRDLKPENIFLVPDPASVTGERIKVLDFGLAKPTHTTSVQTQAATLLGTPSYMSPEQSRSAEIGNHTDIYALGCILFELVTGVPPFLGSLREIITQHQVTRAPRLGTVVADAGPVLEELVAQMLAKDPIERPHSMAVVQHSLTSANHETSVAMASDPRETQPAPSSEPVPSGPGWARKLHRLAAAVGVITAKVGSVAIVLAFHAR